MNRPLSRVSGAGLSAVTCLMVALLAACAGAPAHTPEPEAEAAAHPSGPAGPPAAQVEADSASVEVRARWLQSDFRQRWLDLLPPMPLADAPGEDFLRNLAGALQDRAPGVGPIVDHADMFVVHPEEPVDAPNLVPISDVGLLRLGFEVSAERYAEAVFLTVRTLTGWYVLPLFEIDAQTRRPGETGWSRVAIGEAHYEPVVDADYPELVVQIKFIAQSQADGQAGCVQQRIDFAAVVEHYRGIPHLRALVPTNQAYECDARVTCHTNYFDYIKDVRNTDYLPPGAVEIAADTAMTVPSTTGGTPLDYRLGEEYVEDLGAASATALADRARCRPMAVSHPRSGWHR